MAWIESHQDLATSPKTKRLARMLEITLPQAIGHLHMLWWWVLDHAFDGDLSAFDSFDLAEASGWDGDPDEFVKALIECGPGDKAGFLDLHPRLRVHDWGEFTGHLKAARDASIAGNHQRWHVARGVTSPDCPLCETGESGTDRAPRPSASVPDSPPISHPTPTGIPNDSDGISHRNPPTYLPTDLPTNHSSRRNSSSRDPATDDPPEVSEEARTLTRHFAIGVRGNGHKIPREGQPSHRKWLVEMDRLLRLGPPGGEPEPIDPGEARAVIDWCLTDDFERANVASPAKLRKRYSQLRLKALRTDPARDGPAYDDVFDRITEQEGRRASG